METIKLSNGVEMPLLGYGVFVATMVFTVISGILSSSLMLSSLRDFN